MTHPIERYAQFMERLNKDALPEITNYVTRDVYFRDPFNAVTGADKMQQIFAHMYETMGQVHFDILSQVPAGDAGILHWRFRGMLRGQPWSFEGMSKVNFNADGLVTSHVDYWDAARDFYEYFPVIGWVLKTIRRKIAL